MTGSRPLCAPESTCGLPAFMAMLILAWPPAAAAAAEAAPAAEQPALAYLAWITDFTSLQFDGEAVIRGKAPDHADIRIAFELKETVEQERFLFDTEETSATGMTLSGLQCWDGKRFYAFDHTDRSLAITGTRACEWASIGNPLLLPLQPLFRAYRRSLMPVSLVDARAECLAGAGFRTFCSTSFRPGTALLQQVLVTSAGDDPHLTMSWSVVGGCIVPTHIESADGKKASTIAATWSAVPGKRPVLTGIEIHSTDRAENLESQTSFAVRGMQWDAIQAKDLTFDEGRATGGVTEDGNAVTEPENPPSSL